jgi:hypothetical protein
MSEKHDGGSAFPLPMIPCDNNGGYTEVRCEGMSLRDWFAGMAMQGFLANGYVAEKWAHIASDAYSLADAMITAR